jgi:hypothetical protein
MRSRPSKRLCCVARQRNTVKTCCQQRSAAASAEEAADCCEGRHDNATRPTSSENVIAWQALKCRGQSVHWLSAVPPLMAARLEMTQELPLVRWLGPPTSEVATHAAIAPANPPPESA